MKNNDAKSKKRESLMGIFMVIIYMGIGFCRGINNFDAFTIIWIIGAVILVIATVINAFSKMDANVSQNAIDRYKLKKEVPIKTPKRNSFESLAEIQELYDKGIISEEDYEHVKKSIMKNS